MSQTSNSSHGTEFVQDCAMSCARAQGRDREPMVRQHERLMGRPLSPRYDDLAFPLEEAGMRVRLSF